MSPSGVYTSHITPPEGMGGGVVCTHVTSGVVCKHVRGSSMHTSPLRMGE